ncbi:MAG: hypothetical protein RSE91_04855 [Bacilli bacterium]
MYYDLAILIILIVAVIFFFRKFSSFVYAVVIIDIFLRIMTFIKGNIGLPDVSALITKYLPTSIPDIIGTYAKGVVYTLIMWGFVIIYIIFLTYIIKTLWHKKK